MTITLQPIIADNWIDCINLKPTEEQARLGFVSPNQLSLAQAYAEPWWQPYAIYADDTMVGFVLYGCWPERGIPVHHTDAEPGIHFILRFMIDARYQGRGYGRTSMVALIAQIKREPGAKKIAISYDTSNSVMERLCRSVGFQPTGRVIDDEIEACIVLR